MSVLSGAAEGKAAYGNGAFYVGQESSEGNSESFAKLEEKGAELATAIEAISTMITSKISEAEANKATAQGKLSEYQAKIIANNKRIDNLNCSRDPNGDNSGIDAEIARLYAENEKLRKKCENCEKVIAALGADIGILNGLTNNVSSASTSLGS